MSYSLNGSTQFFNAPAPFLGGTAITASATVNFNSLASENKVMGVWNDGGGAGFMWLITTNGSTQILVAIVDSGSGFTLAGGGTLTTGVDTRLALRYNGATLQAFINGVSVDSQPQTLAMASPPLALWSIGAGTDISNNPTNPTNGLISEPRVWNVGLTDGEMLADGLGQNAFQIRPQSLVRYAPLVNNLNELVTGATITAVASPTVAVHPPIYGL